MIIRESFMIKPKLSIITICFNEKNIEDTCRSVAGQTWKNFEWIVVDGGSTDGTLEVLERYREDMRVCISEKDDGRYHAMNKGIVRARGEYLLFLNGGDYLAHDRVLECIFEYKPIARFERYLDLRFDADILYGEILARETGMMPWPLWYGGPQQFSLEYFAKQSLPHQATFIRRELFEKYGLYDTTYQFAGDYEWFMRVLLLYGASSAYIPMPVSIYNFEGARGVEGDGLPVLENIKAYDKYKAMQGKLPQSPPEPPTGVPDKEIIAEVLNYNKIRLKYWKYKVFSRIAFGKMRKRYNKKRKVYKIKVQNIRRFIIEHRSNHC